MKTSLDNSSTDTASRAELCRICEEIYGTMPNAPLHLDTEIISEDRCFAAGKAVLKKQNLILEFEEDRIKMPFTAVIPTFKSTCPAIICIGYENEVPNKYLPAEEIIDRGYAILAFSFDDAASNDGNFKNGISTHIARSRRKKSAPGKLAVWAYAAMRLMEHASSLEYIDKDNIAVSGHGLMAKAAMLAGALSKECSFIIANDPLSAFGSHGISSSKTAPYIDYPYLFSPGYAEKPRIDEQRLLLSLCADKNILVGSAIDDIRSNPIGEYEMLLALTNEGYFTFGIREISSENKIPDVPCRIQDGNISFHARAGRSYFGREDWNIYLDFIDKKMAKSR